MTGVTASSTPRWRCGPSPSARSGLPLRQPPADVPARPGAGRARCVTLGEPRLGRRRAGRQRRRATRWPSFRRALAAAGRLRGDPSTPASPLTDQLKHGLDAPICLTWELTYACNLACVHCLSSSGRRDPRELSTAEAMARHRRAARPAGLLRQHRRRRADDPPRLLRARRLRGRPRRRRQVLDQRHDHRRRSGPAAWPARTTSTCRSRIDGADAATNDAVRGDGSLRHGPAGHGPPRRRRLRPVQDQRRRDPPQRRPARRARSHWPTATAPSCGSPGCVPSGRGADTWDELHPTAEQQVAALPLAARAGPDVLTGDSFFHLSALGEPLPGLNLCGAGRVVCLIDPIGDVYACPFVLHDEFRAGCVRDPGGFTACGAESELFRVAARAAVGRGVRLVRLATTPARAAAWRRSSSPGCRSTVPTPSACTGHGELAPRSAWPRCDRPPATPVPRPLGAGARLTRRR